MQEEMSSGYDFVFNGAWREDFDAFQDLELKTKVEKAFQDMTKFLQNKRGIKKCVVKVECKDKTYSIYYEKP